VIGPYRNWKEGRDDPGEVAITDSSQFFDVCQNLDVHAKVISCHARREHLIDGRFDIEHRPNAMQAMRGPFYRLGLYLYHLFVCWTAIRGRYDTLVLMTWSHLGPFWLGKWLGRRIILVEQCVLWPKLRGWKGMWRLVHRRDRRFYLKGCETIISISQDTTDQIDVLTKSDHAPVVPFLSVLSAESFLRNS
jgi:glycogen(starch) synthase